MCHFLAWHETLTEAKTETDGNNMEDTRMGQQLPNK